MSPRRILPGRRVRAAAASAFVVIGAVALWSNPAFAQPPSPAPAASVRDPAWSAPVSFDPAATEASAVSCPVSTWCAAVDGGPDAWTWTGRWSLPATVAGAVLEAVSCATTTFCVATGSTPSGSGSDTFAAVWNGTRWAPAPGFVPVATVGGLPGVSCPGAGFCVAVGDEVATTVPDVTLAETFVRGSWSAEALPDPSVPGSEGYSLHAVSCARPGSCAVLGAVDVGPYVSPFAETLTGDRWMLDDTPGVGPDDTLSSVSCSEPWSCTAVGTAVTPLSPTPPTALVDVYAGGAWRVQIAPPPTPLWSVSCDPARCTAGGDGVVVDETAGAWGTPRDVDAPHLVTGASCPTVSFCMVTDNAGDSLVGDPA